MVWWAVYEDSTTSDVSMVLLQKYDALPFQAQQMVITQSRSPDLHSYIWPTCYLSVFFARDMLVSSQCGEAGAFRYDRTALLYVDVSCTRYLFIMWWAASFHCSFAEVRCDPLYRLNKWPSCKSRFLSSSLQQVCYLSIFLARDTCSWCGGLHPFRCGRTLPPTLPLPLFSCRSTRQMTDSRDSRAGEVATSVSRQCS